MEIWANTGKNGKKGKLAPQRKEKTGIPHSNCKNILTK